jgi:RNA polymerase sigma factor (sigma-70 family)
VTADGELVSLAMAGDAMAFGQLVGRHERSLRAVAFYVIRDIHLAEDVVQDSFVAAYGQLAGLRNPSAFGAWMVQIVRRQAQAAIGHRIHTVPLDQASEVPAIGTSLDVDSERLLAAMMSLSEDERLVLMLRHFDGHEVTAIAQMTSEHVGTVTKRLSRAHAHLRERLKECRL